MSILGSSGNSYEFKELFEFTQGIEVDARLYKSEIKVQIAWARELKNLNFLSSEEFCNVENTLHEAAKLISEGKFPWRVEDEDIHMNLERYVTERLGDVGKKMHVGRSRNDLIATTLRLNLAECLVTCDKNIVQLQLALLEQAEKNKDVLVPGMTHTQHGQPIRLAQFYLAHAWALLRDRKRCEQAKSGCLNYMPLGAAALSGTPLNVNQKAIAKELGFINCSHNSYDAVSDRDFILESLSCIANTALHLSRMAEDFIYYSSTAVSLLKIPKDWSTGSSIMPNKRNPDVPELVRAKSAHCMAAHSNALTLMKGLPLSYNSDLHELKQVFFRSFDELSKSLCALAPFVRNLETNKEIAKMLLMKGHILATEFADAAVKAGKTFREAYKEVAGQVAEAEGKGLQIHDSQSEINFENSIEKRKHDGGTALNQINLQIESLRTALD